jgi:two-component system phosphate regulon sensor histidine kinase PhoR
LNAKSGELRELLCQYFTGEKAAEIVEGGVRGAGLSGAERISIMQLIELHTQVERALAGSIGSASAYQALHRGVVLSARECRELPEVYAQIIAELKVTPAELKCRIDDFQEREMLLQRQAVELAGKVADLEREIQERKRIQQALRDSEEMFRGLVETMNEGVHIQDENGIITYVNQKLCVMLGYDRDEIVGSPSVRFLEDWRPREGEGDLCGGDLAKPGAFEVAWSTSDGLQVSTIISHAPLFDAEGNYRGRFSVVTDISRMKAHEREKANMISMFAHDMRSSLTGIHGLGLRLISKSASMDEEKKSEYLQIITREASKLESLVDDFLEFSRLETGRLKLSFMAVSLDSELMELYEIYRLRCIPKGLKLEIHIDEALPIIEADLNRLRRVFTNLLDNAMKFSRDSGTITIEAEEAQRGLVVRVIDQGIGIEPTEAPFIFDIFHRSRCEGRREGYGIGLATVKAIVEGHGGSIRVESVPGEGSAFTIFLPGKRTPKESR